MSRIKIVCNSRAEKGPLESVIAALPEAEVFGVDVSGLPPASGMAHALTEFQGRLVGASLVIVLGDRYETLAVALAAMFLRIPVAHIHGGETTTGAFDDALRDSITRVAEQSGGLHFVATTGALDRVESLTAARGERYKYTHLVGAPGLDGIPKYSAKRDTKNILVTFHPETMSPDYGRGLCQAMLDALAKLDGYTIWFTGVNADPGNELIRADIEAFVGRYGTYGIRGPKAWIKTDWSHAEYVRQMQHAALVIGNSSAGIIEAPWIGVPTVNIGNRQDGREYAMSIFQDDDNIGAAIENALCFVGDPRAIYEGGAAEKIAAIVRQFVTAREVMDKRRGALKELA